MENSSGRRGKLMLAMLNQDLRKRFADQKNSNKHKNNDENIDPDFEPYSNINSPRSKKNSKIEIKSHYKIQTLPSSSSSITDMLPNKSITENSSIDRSVNGMNSTQDCSNVQTSSAAPLEICLSSSNSKDQCMLIDKAEEENSYSIVFPIIEDLIDSALHQALNKFTKQGTIRKRRKFDTSLTERMAKKAQKKVLKHAVKPSCHANCCLQCSRKIHEDTRRSINELYWSSSRGIQNNFLLNSVKRVPIKRRTVVVCAEPPRKSTTFNYFFKDDAGNTQRVCKVFFLGTLGYHPHDDRFLRKIVSDENKHKVIYQSKKQFKVTPNQKIDRDVIIEHINSFRPTISHYRRAHAPNRRYLPSDLSIAQMHKHFRELHPSMEISYGTYRQVVTEQNISFVKLGHEECWSCEIFDLHSKQMVHAKENLPDECDMCQKWKIHIQKANSSRDAYQEDSKSALTPDHLIVSADLQKVIMLPRLETFKEVIFTQRIIAFNESFVPVGSNRGSDKTCAIVWHEAIAGRSKSDITCAFHRFLLMNRDARSITIWMDNCSSQNKNWGLFCFFIYVINSNDILAEKIELKYFEPGHTFMSADSFHHRVEHSLKKKGKVYDFQDFVDCVQNSGKNIVVGKMEIQNFRHWLDYTSQYKLAKINPRPYLQTMVHIIFKRGERVLQYRTSFTGSFSELNFLKAKAFKSGMPPPKAVLVPRGVSKERKDAILSRLSRGIPFNRHSFWQDLPVSQTDIDSSDSDSGNDDQ